MFNMIDGRGFGPCPDIFKPMLRTIVSKSGLGLLAEDILLAGIWGRAKCSWL